MNDYLANLAARTLGFTPVVQPRLSSLFEPPRLTDGFAEGASAHSETVENLTVSIEPNPATDLPAPLVSSPLPELPTPDRSLPPGFPTTPDLSVVRAPGQAPSPFSARVVRPEGDSPSAPRTPPPAGPSKPSLAGSPADGERAGRSDHLEQPRPSARRSWQDRVPRRSQRVTVLAGRNPRQPARESSEPPLPPASPVTARHEPRIAPRESWSEPGATLSDPSRLSQAAIPLTPKPSAASTGAEPPRATLLPRELPLQALPLLRPPGRPDHEPKAASKSSANIHVTIGRVEVRATTTTPVRTHRTPAAAPVLGLEEYLRRRAGGGSR